MSSDAHSTGEDAEVLQIAQMATLFTPWSLRLAVTFRLPDLVAGGCTALGELAERSGTDPAALRRVVRHLTNLGLFRRIDDEHVELTGRGRVLCADHPSQTARFLDQNDAFARRTDQAIPGLLESVRTGAAAWESRFGRPFWTDLAADEEFSASFDAAMAVHAARFAPAIAEGYGWSGVRHVVDVGGGTGQVIAELLRRYPHLTGTLVDLPGTVERAAASPELAALAGRCAVVGQSFFEVLPDDGDVYLLSNIVHDWPDEDSVDILRRCAAAAGPGGRVLLAERVVADTGSEASRRFVSQRDMAMLLLMGAAERGLEEFGALGAAAGLRLVSTVSLIDGQGVFLLEYVPAA
ncbi:SAM-dependent methyltransferase [Saccharopolyspora indica]|uniref:methyltransferase n=1 Tax=Saccharopolyspora indica TaxID=1229659 RepID=UPI0022EAD4EA|nr:methyltransferase [Saccharopolyspora indica]MDA3643104.1 methyltransferase [Saccharopolyspora indica]